MESRLRLGWLQDRSTSGGAILRRRHTLKTWSATQKNETLSSGEAELGAMVKMSWGTIGVTQLATTAPPAASSTSPAMRLQRPCRAQQSPRLPPPGSAPGLALPCRSRSVLRGAAPAPSLSRVAPSPSLSRDWSRAWPSRAAHQSLPLSCASLVSLARQLLPRALRGLLVKPLRPLLQPKPLRPPALLTSRPTLTATSEDHGEELTDLVFSCATGAGRGERAICTFSRIMRTLCRMWAFLVLLALEFENSFAAAAEVDSLETLRMRRSPTRAITIPGIGCARQSSPW